MPAQTGLSQLGDALLRGSGDYANIQLRRQAEERQRAQQLADLQGSRQYAEGQDTLRRTNNLADAKTATLFAQRLEALKQAVSLGLMAATDIGNVAVEDAALAKLAAKMAGDAARDEQVLKDAQDELNRLAVDRDTLVGKDTALDTRLQKVERDYQTAVAASELVLPSPVEIEAEAARLAAAAGVKLATTQPKRGEQLRDYTAQAEQALSRATNASAFSAQKQATALAKQHDSLVREKSAGIRQLEVIRQGMNDLQRAFSGKIAAVRAKASPSQSLEDPAVTTEPTVPGIATEADRQAARDKARGAGGRTFPTDHPSVTNADGRTSNVKLATVSFDGITRVIPTMVGGVQLSMPDAINVAKQNGFAGYPSFRNEAEADAWIQANHGNIGQDGSIAKPLPQLQDPSLAPAPDNSGAPGANPGLAALLFADKAMPAARALPGLFAGALKLGGTVAKNAFPVGRAAYGGYAAGDLLNSAPKLFGGDRVSDYIANLISQQPEAGDYMSEDRAKAAGLRRSLSQPMPPLNPLPRRTPAAVFSSFDPWY